MTCRGSRARAARQKLHTAGCSDPQKLALIQPGMLSIRPSMHGMTSTGASRHVLGEVLGRAGDPGLGRVTDRVAGRDAARVVRHVAVGVERLLVHRADRLALVGVGHDHPVPALLVRPGRRLRRHLDALPHELDRHRPIEVEPLAHRPRGRQQLVRRQVQGGSHRAILPRTLAPPEIAFDWPTGVWPHERQNASGGQRRRPRPCRPGPR